MTLNLEAAARAVREASKDWRFMHQLRSARKRGEDGEDLWMVANLVSAHDAGIYQTETILELLDLKSNVYFRPPDGEFEMEYALEEIDEEAERLTSALQEKVDLPLETGVRIGYWSDGGCFGVILYFEKKEENDTELAIVPHR